MHKLVKVINKFVEGCKRAMLRKPALSKETVEMLYKQYEAYEERWDVRMRKRVSAASMKISIVRDDIDIEEDLHFFPEIVKYNPRDMESEADLPFLIPEIVKYNPRYALFRQARKHMTKMSSNLDEILSSMCRLNKVFKDRMKKKNGADKKDVKALRKAISKRRSRFKKLGEDKYLSFDEMMILPETKLCKFSEKTARDMRELVELYELVFRHTDISLNELEGNINELETALEAAENEQKNWREMERAGTQTKKQARRYGFKHVPGLEGDDLWGDGWASTLGFDECSEYADRIKGQSDYTDDDPDKKEGDIEERKNRVQHFNFKANRLVRKLREKVQLHQKSKVKDVLSHIAEVINKFLEGCKRAILRKFETPVLPKELVKILYEQHEYINSWNFEKWEEHQKALAEIRTLLFMMGEQISRSLDLFGKLNYPRYLLFRKARDHASEMYNQLYRIYHSMDDLDQVFQDTMRKKNGANKKDVKALRKAISKRRSCCKEVNKDKHLFAIAMVSSYEHFTKLHDKFLERTTKGLTSLYELIIGDIDISLNKLEVKVNELEIALEAAENEQKNRREMEKARKQAKKTGKREVRRCKLKYGPGLGVYGNGVFIPDQVFFIELIERVLEMRNLLRSLENALLCDSLEHLQENISVFMKEMEFVDLDVFDKLRRGDEITEPDKQEIYLGVAHFFQVMDGLHNVLCEVIEQRDKVNAEKVEVIAPMLMAIPMLPIIQKNTRLHELKDILEKYVSPDVPEEQVDSYEERDNPEEQGSYKGAHALLILEAQRRLLAVKDIMHHLVPKEAIEDIGYQEAIRKVQQDKFLLIDIYQNANFIVRQWTEIDSYIKALHDIGANIDECKKASLEEVVEQAYSDYRQADLQCRKLISFIERDIDKIVKSSGVDQEDQTKLFKALKGCVKLMDAINNDANREFDRFGQNIKNFQARPMVSQSDVIKRLDNVKGSSVCSGQVSAKGHKAIAVFPGVVHETKGALRSFRRAEKGAAQKEALVEIALRISGATSLEEKLKRDDRRNDLHYRFSLVACTLLECDFSKVKSPAKK